MHIAAGKPSPHALVLLREYEYDDDWPVEEMEGRTPLATLCVLGQGEGQNWEQSVHETMKLLMPSQDKEKGERANFKDGKTLLHLAIGNVNAAVPLVRAFLATARTWLDEDRDEKYLVYEQISDLEEGRLSSGVSSITVKEHQCFTLLCTCQPDVVRQRDLGLVPAM